MTILSISRERDKLDKFAEEFGLSCVESNEWKLLYESELISLCITLDIFNSYELNIELGEKKSSSGATYFSLPEILKFRNSKEAEFASRLAITNQEALSRIMIKIINLIADNAAEFLAGNKGAFLEIQDWRNKECQYFAIESKLKYARAIVGEAWLSKDYSTVIEALSPLEDYITSTELKKLEYARQKHNSVKPRRN